jgi:SAM-dependent methyltransferase
MSERSLAEEWEARAHAWERWTRTPGHDHHFHRYNWPAFLELIPCAGRATLDLGCGEGRGGGALHNLGHVLTGVDTAPSLAQLASQTGAYESVLVADAAALPLADDTFDLVVAFMSLQDMDNAAGALQEAARVLAPGGYVAAAFVHPVASARLSREAAQQRSYFDVQRTVDEIEHDGIAFTFHQMHRPLHAWLALFLDAGFVIDGLREPRPSEQDIATSPTLAKSRAEPTFLHVRARHQQRG